MSAPERRGIPQGMSKREAARVRKSVYYMNMAAERVREYGAEGDEALAARLEQLSQEMWNAAARDQPL